MIGLTEDTQTTATAFAPNSESPASDLPAKRWRKTYISRTIFQGTDQIIVPRLN
jgi:hypothetical protein